MNNVFWKERVVLSFAVSSKLTSLKGCQMVHAQLHVVRVGMHDFWIILWTFSQFSDNNNAREIWESKIYYVFHFSDIMSLHYFASIFSLNSTQDQEFFIKHLGLEGFMLYQLNSTYKNSTHP